MAAQTTVTITLADDVPAATAPSITFVPQVSIHPLAALTLGRQTFNDSDSPWTRVGSATVRAPDEAWDAGLLLRSMPGG
ncbi:hypothetical protein ACWF94_01930 [Streptomyces sp. NPDC055078]